MRKKITVFILSIFSTILVLALATSPIEAKTETLTKTFYPTDDTCISQEKNQANYGSDSTLKTRDNYGFANSSGWGWDALTKFDTSSIPNESKILSATLNLYFFQKAYFNQSHDKLNIYHLTNNWNENNTTWDNQPTYLSDPLTNSTITDTTNTWTQWNITDDVKKIVNNTIQNYGWRITDDKHWGHFDIPEFIFKSKENNDNTLKPYLEIKIKNHIPKSAFNYTINISNKKANFTDNSNDSDGPIVSWSWEFGDGTTSNQKNVSHNYTGYGEFQVNLTVEDNLGVKTKTTKTILLNIEEKVKQEIEKTFNITLAENFYANDYNEFNDPNEILTVEQTINDDNITFLISVNNSFEKLFLWNTIEDNITLVKPKQGPLIQNIKINNNTFQIDFNITQNESSWNYIQINDFCPNISNLTVKRSDKSIVPACYIFRENQKIYILDKDFSSYYLTYSNSTVETINESINKKDANLANKKLDFDFQMFFLLISISAFLLVPFSIFAFKKRRLLNNYLQTGQKRINELDNFLKEKQKKD